MAFTRLLRATVPRAARAFDTACALVLLLGVFIAANAARMPDGVGDFLSARVGVRNVIALAVFLVLWDTSFGVLGLHEPRRWRLSDQALRVARATSMGTLPLLLFPLIVPVLLSAVKATSLLILGDPMGQVAGWAKLLLAFNLIHWSVCGLLFGRVVED